MLTLNSYCLQYKHHKGEEYIMEGNMKTAFIYLIGLVVAIMVACWFADATVKAIEVENYVSDAERIQRAKILKGEH